MKSLFLVAMTVWAFYRHDGFGVALGIWLLYESRPESLRNIPDIHTWKTENR